MAEENEESQEETKEAPPKKGNKMLIIIIAVVVIVLAAGGFVGFKLMSGGEEKTEEAESEKKKSKTAIMALDPFVLNLKDQGRYLKVSIQFEIAEESMLEDVQTKTPQLRDTIITLVSSKPLNSIASPEGKFQLKDEILFRANQILGLENDIFKNLYFTE
nr:flagellar basal body-associated FliL family protein [Candidatus Brocadiales bacterium]